MYSVEHYLQIPNSFMHACSHAHSFHGQHVLSHLFCMAPNQLLSMKISLRRYTNHKRTFLSGRKNRQACIAVLFPQFLKCHMQYNTYDWMLSCPVIYLEYKIIQKQTTSTSIHQFCLYRFFHKTQKTGRRNDRFYRFYTHKPY